MRKAKDIMTREVLTVSPDMTVSELASFLTVHSINGAPVVDDNGELLGVVTENDLIYQKKKVHIPTVINILDSVIYLESPEKMKQEMQKITGVTVRDIFTEDVIQVDKDASIEEIATLMAEQKIHTIPVVDNGSIIGIIGKGDIIKTLINQEDETTTT